MTIIYYHPLSFPALTAIFAAEAMGISYEKKLVDLTKGEHKSEDYLAINPYGKIPALKDGDFMLAESNAIARYLAVRENSPLYGPDLQARAKIDQWMDFIVNHVRSNVGKVQFNRVVAKMFGREGDMKSAEQGVAGLMQNLPHIEAQLETSNFLCGDDMTLADIVLIASLEPVEMAGIDISAFPAVQAFLTAAREETFYTNVHTHFGAELGK